MVDVLARLNPLAIAHLVFFIGFIPWVVLRRSGRARPPNPALRLHHYRYVCTQFALFALFSGVVARSLHIPLGGAPRHPLLDWTAAAALAALFYFSLAPYRRERIARRDPHALLLAPSPDRVGWWALVSLLAGVVEEFTYRGVASSILLWAGAPVWAAVLVVSAAFGLAHAGRGWVHVAVTFGIGALLHVLVLASGSLWPAMAAHAVYDFFAGLSFGRMAREEAWSPDAA